MRFRRDVDFGQHALTSCVCRRWVRSRSWTRARKATCPALTRPASGSLGTTSPLITSCPRGAYAVQKKNGGQTQDTGTGFAAFVSKAFGAPAPCEAAAPARTSSDTIRRSAASRLRCAAVAHTDRGRWQSSSADPGEEGQTHQRRAAGRGSPCRAARRPGREHRHVGCHCAQGLPVRRRCRCWAAAGRRPEREHARHGRPRTRAAPVRTSQRANAWEEGLALFGRQSDGSKASVRSHARTVPFRAAVGATAPD